MGMKSRRSSSSSTSGSPSIQRAWRLLRLAMLWARQGGIMKCRLFMAELRLIPKHLKSLKPHHHHHRHTTNQLASHYCERQLSFNETPMIQMGMSRLGTLRFMIPACMKPDHSMFDYDFEEIDRAEEEISCIYGDEDDDEEEEVEEGIDEKAEEFINKFHTEMKLQRQISYLKYVH